MALMGAPFDQVFNKHLFDYNEDMNRSEPSFEQLQKVDRRKKRHREKKQKLRQPIDKALISPGGALYRNHKTPEQYSICDHQHSFLHPANQSDLYSSPNYNQEVGESAPGLYNNPFQVDFYDECNAQKEHEVDNTEEIQEGEISNNDYKNDSNEKNIIKNITPKITNSNQDDLMIDISIYTMAGIILIIVLEQFIMIGKMMK